MAYFQPTLAAKYASWFHPMWRLSGGVAVDADTTEVVAALDAGASWGTDANHGYVAGVTYSAGARVEVSSSTHLVTYQSLSNGNIGHTPASSPSFWQLVSGGDGLGADDEHWITTTGLLRPFRNDSGDLWDPHLYARSGGVASAHWDAAASGGQWSMASGGTVPCPAVRMSASADTCYYATIANDGTDDYAQLYRVVNGTVTLIGTAPGYLPAGNAAFLVYAYEDTVGVAAGTTVADATTGWPGSGWTPASYGVAYDIQVEVTDTAITLADGPYIGVRAPAGTGSIHEWYGGTFGVLTANASPAGDGATLSGLRRPGTTITVT